MRVFVLAAGEGTRLRPLTLYIPKSMLPVAGRPTLVHIIERLKKHGFTDIVLCVGYLGDQIIDYFGDGLRFGVKISYSKSEHPLGTAGELLHAKNYINGQFLLHYGDELTEINLRELIEYHKKSNGIGTLALVKNIPLEVGVVEVDKSGNILNFKEKPPLEKLTWAGIGVFEKEILNFITQPEGLDFARDVFPAVLKAGKKLCGYISEATWLDVGLPHHLEMANKLLSNQNK